SDNLDDDEGPDFKAILITKADTPETEYVRGLFWDQLFSALEELPAKQRQVFIWHELEDVPFGEIAELTGENVQTLVSRKRYAVLHLRKRLHQLYDEIKEYEINNNEKFILQKKVRITSIGYCGIYGNHWICGYDIMEPNPSLYTSCNHHYFLAGDRYIYFMQNII